MVLEESEQEHKDNNGEYSYSLLACLLLILNDDGVKQASVFVVGEDRVQGER